MPLLTRKREDEGVKGGPIPKVIEERLKRGRQAMLKEAPARRVAYKFWVGEHYWYVNARNQLQVLDTALFGGKKPGHRIRNKYNFLRLMIEAKVSASTQRVPGYEITPSTDDRQDQEAAITAAQVGAYLYDKIGVRRATTKVVTNALVQREGFAMPYFDPDVGPYTEQINLQTGDVEVKGRGEIKILTLSRSELAWEAGVDFEDSPWWAIIRATPVDEVEQIPGFYGGTLTKDASTADVPTDKDTDNMVILTKYLERPSKQHPEGQCRYFANKREICPKGTYTSIGPDGKVTDDPVIHRLSYTVNPEGDDQGLAEVLIDPQRTINDSWNKILEWKNRCLNPQMTAPIGAFVKGLTQLDDIPGVIRYYNPVGLHKPEWEKPPQIPAELQQILELAITHMRALAADVDVQPDPRLAAKTASQAVEQSQLRWQSFLGDLGEFHSRLMRHCLTLVQVYYEDERTIQIDGEYGYRTLSNFKGEDLRSQVNVRVAPGSLESQSRQAIRDEVQFVATTWPGAVSPEAGIAAIHNGVGKNMLRSYENHVSRAWRLVKTAEQGMEALDAMPARFDANEIDPLTGQIGMMVPGWMPRKQDNIDIWQNVLGDYMTSVAYDRQSVDIRHVFDLIWDALEQIKTQRVMAEAMQRDAMAAGQGLDNAAAPQAPPPLPDRSQVAPR